MAAQVGKSVPRSDLGLVYIQNLGPGLGNLLLEPGPIRQVSLIAQRPTETLRQNPPIDLAADRERQLGIDQEAYRNQWLGQRAAKLATEPGRAEIELRGND